MITLDLPTPLSTNRTRKIDWAAKRTIDAWIDNADRLVMSQGKLPNPIMGRYEATVILRDGSGIDIDNTVKGVLDYAKRIGLVGDDSPTYLRKLTVEFGDAPEGCKLMLRAIEKPKAYDAEDDMTRSIEDCYEAVRERVKAGGPSWPTPEPERG